jgi:predicted secreted protein
MAASSVGDFFVAVCADKSIRVWRQTNEQTFLVEQQDERDDKKMLKEAEQEYTEIDIARENQIDPFAKDKVLKIET